MAELRIYVTVSLGLRITSEASELSEPLKGGTRYKDMVVNVR